METLAARIIDYGALNELFHEIEQISDEHEKEIRNQLVDEVMDKMMEYDIHCRQYEYEKLWDKWKVRGLIRTACQKEEVSRLWDELFLSAVTKEAKARSKMYNEQFRWHIFSFELLEAMSKNEADKTFEAMRKNLLFVFFQYGENAYQIENADFLSAEDLRLWKEYSTLEESDIYIFDPAAQWTYVLTHEEACGPYFYQTKEDDEQS